MEILKDGRDPSKDVFVGQCTMCNAIVEFNRSESSQNNLDCAWVECPSCKHTLICGFKPWSKLAVGIMIAFMVSILVLMISMIVIDGL